MKIANEINLTAHQCIETSTQNDKEYSSYRLSDAVIANLPKETKDYDLMRITLSNLFETKFGRNYAKLETLCDIKRDTFQKLVNLRLNKGFSRDILEKFCIGAGLTEEEAINLFKLAGIILNPKESRLDSLFLLSLKDRSDISDYNDDRIKAGFESIF